MELEQITVKKFKKVSEVTLDLADLNILVGANSSGKSSILQAIHLASCLLRQTSAPVRSNKSSPVSINELDYLPTNDYKKLGHNYDWGTQIPGNVSTVSFSFNDNGDKVQSQIAMKQARNIGISTLGSLGKSTSIFRPKSGSFSAYVSGISGISNEEAKQSKRVVLKGCSFGDGNAYLRNALHLLDEKKDITTIEKWLSELIGDIEIIVEHNDEKNLTIKATARLGGSYRDVPLELLGMGYIQLIQIFCYLLLFEPKILLIDEPDIHLHPNVQEKLPKVLLGVARERNIKIILATHSPFIVRGSPVGTNVYWMDNGAVQHGEREAIESALGWGAFGKKAILISEDKNIKLLRHILAQWPEIERQVAIIPGSGYRNLPTPDGAEDFRKGLGNNFKIVIHRDRDSMLDNEMDMLMNLYRREGVCFWITDLSNIESYFCVWDFIKTLDNLPSDFSEEKLNEIIESYNFLENEKFISQRKAHNEELHSAGGSPTNQEVWDDLQSRQLKAACGSLVFNEIKNKLNDTCFSEVAILSKELEGNIASSLKDFLENLL